MPGLRIGPHVVLTVWSLVALVLPAAASAQQPSPGERVRIVTLDERVLMTGVLESWSEDTVHLTNAGRSQAFVLDGSRWLEVNTGTRSHAMLGAAVGIVAGALVGALVPCDAEEEDPFADAIASSACSWFRPIAIGSFAVVGLASGALLGWTLFRTDSWERVTIESRLGVGTATTGQVALGIRYRF